MQKRTSLCDLYKQPYDPVIKEYEDKAFLYLAEKGLIECCGGHPRFGRRKKLFIKTACDMYEQDKQKQAKGKRKSDKFK